MKKHLKRLSIVMESLKRINIVKRFITHYVTQRMNYIRTVKSILDIMGEKLSFITKLFTSLWS